MASIYIKSGIYPGVEGLGFFAYFGLDSSWQGYKRLQTHERDLRNKKHDNDDIQKFYDERGPDQFYNGIIIECDKYYLNTLEKSYIKWGNSNKKFNPYGWNHSSGGEGAKRNFIPYSFIKGDDIFEGNDLLQFLTISGQAEPGGFIELLDGRKKEYEGYLRYKTL